MARIPLPNESDPTLPEDTRAFLQDAGQTRGSILNIYRALANRPEAGRAFMDLIGTVYRGNSTLEPKHGELAYLTATVVNNCYY